MALAIAGHPLATPLLWHARLLMVCNAQLLILYEPLPLEEVGGTVWRDCCYSGYAISQLHPAHKCGSCFEVEVTAYTSS